MYEGFKESEIPYPAKTVALIDREDYDSSTRWAYYRAWGSATSNPDSWTGLHNGGHNLLLADGHANWYKVMQFLSRSAGGDLYWSP